MISSTFGELHAIHNAVWHYKAAAAVILVSFIDVLKGLDCLQKKKTN